MVLRRNACRPPLWMDVPSAEAPVFAGMTIGAIREPPLRERRERLWRSPFLCRPNSGLLRNDGLSGEDRTAHDFGFVAGHEGGDFGYVVGVGQVGDL